MPNFDRHHDEISAQQRVDEDPVVQGSFGHLVQCGAPTLALAVAALLDRCGISADALDLLNAWKTVDPRTCPRGFNSPTPKRRPRVDLRLVPPAPEPEHDS
jgi:hypothetical protein